MALFHDLDETRSNDMNWVHKKYVKTFDKQIRKDQLALFGKDNEILTIITEYEERKTLEAKVTKDADMLDQFLILKEHEMTGNKEAQRWLKGRKDKFIITNSAKKLATKIQEQRPSEWWDNIWTNKRR
jgi:putative hydrolase of HD superfamily